MSRPRKDRREPSRDVAVSKALSYLLRHAAEKEGLKMNSQGYANVADVVRTISASLYFNVFTILVEVHFNLIIIL
jgi:RNA:NAD 2'-phosphotransferase (TPT1/KptA family)